MTFPILQSEIGMPVARIMGLEDSSDGIQVQIHWKGLEDSEDSLEPLQRAYEDVSQMVERLLKRKSIPSKMVQKARASLAL